MNFIMYRARVNFYKFIEFSLAHTHPHPQMHTARLMWHTFVELIQKLGTIAKLCLFVPSPDHITCAHEAHTKYQMCGQDGNYSKVIWLV